MHSHIQTVGLTLTMGILTVHNSPPNLQLICNRIFCAILFNFAWLEIVRTLMAWGQNIQIYLKAFSTKGFTGNV